jgi:LCP family protein required for cell wall assembly
MPEAVEPGGRPRPRAPREPSSLTPAMRIRRAVTLLVITVFAPGSAQFAAGDRRIGRAALRVWLAVLALGAFAGLLALIARPVFLSFATSPTMLVLVALGCFFAAAGWSFLLIDAWRLGRPQMLPRRPRLLVSLLAFALVLVIAVPMVGAGRRAWAAADFINSVFGSGRASEASHGRYNVLLMGGDAGADRIGVRPDSMTLASIDADTGRTVLFSLPRNLENVPFPPGSAAAKALPRGWDCGDNCLLNALYTWGQKNKALFPEDADPGAAVMKQAVAGVTGLEVNYYVLIDLRGFSNLIDAMDGIDVTVNTRVPIGGGTSKVSGYIEPGHRHLDGYRALWYARSRHGANDYERMARQRCVMDAMLQQLEPAMVLTKFQALAAAGKNVVSTDVPGGQLDMFLGLAAKAKSQRISSVQFVPPLINPARPDLHLIRTKVSAAIDASEKASASAAVRPTPSSGSSGSSSGSSSGTSGESSAGSSSARSSSRTAGRPAAIPSPAASPVAEASDITAVCSPG